VVRIKSCKYKSLFVGLLELLGFIELLEFIELLGLIGLFGLLVFVGLLGLLGLLELFGLIGLFVLLELGVKIFNETGVLFRHDLCLFINLLEIFLGDIVLVKSYI
jgi:hypothetical protein